MFKLPAELTHDQAQACLAELQQALEGISLAAGAGQPASSVPWVVDASALTRFDSSALAVLLASRRMALAQGRSIQVQGLPPRLRQLAGLYGIASLIPANDAAGSAATATSESR